MAWIAVLPLLLTSGVVPTDGFAKLPIAGIILGGTMVAVSVVSRAARDALILRSGEVAAALSLGLTVRDSRMEIIRRPATVAAESVAWDKVERAETAVL